MDIKAALYQITGKDNWETILLIDDFVRIFDRMPKRMRLCVDYKIQGLEVSEISKLMRVKQESVRRQLRKAKKYFCISLTETSAF